MPEKVDSQLIKTINERRILNLIKDEGPVSRNKLAKLTHLSKVSVSTIVSRLTDEGYILEIGKGESTSKGGKRPSLLQLNPDNGYVIGIQMKRGSATIALADIKSEIKGISIMEFPVKESLDMVLDGIFTRIDKLFQKLGVPQEKLVNIGIGIPGFLDYDRGELRFSVTFRNWVNLPLASRFAERYNVPVVIENDVNTVTLSEYLLGAGQGYLNQACIFFDSGVGAGYIVDGQVMRGEDSRSGEVGYFELGHFVSYIERMENLYNNQRYFGELLSEVNLVDTLKVKLQANEDADVDSLSLLDMLHMGQNGDLIVQEILNEYAYPLAVICLNIIKSLNPGLIILSGQIIHHSPYLHRKVTQLVKQSMINLPFEPCPIVLGDLKDKAGVLGAVVLALQTIYEPPVKKTNSGTKVWATN